MISQNLRMLQLRRLVKRPPTPLEEALARSIAEAIDREVLEEIVHELRTKSENDE